jgi:hypothetical protein
LSLAKAREAVVIAGRIPARGAPFETRRALPRERRRDEESSVPFASIGVFPSVRRRGVDSEHVAAMVRRERRDVQRDSIGT